MSKQELVKKHLLEGKTITHLEAERLYHHSRVSSTIHRLREKGYNVKTDMITDGESEFALYYIENKS